MQNDRPEFIKIICLCAWKNICPLFTCIFFRGSNSKRPLMDEFTRKQLRISLIEMLEWKFLHSSILFLYAMTAVDSTEIIQNFSVFSKRNNSHSHIIKKQLFPNTFFYFRIVFSTVACTKKPHFPFVLSLIYGSNILTVSQRIRHVNRQRSSRKASSSTRTDPNRGFADEIYSDFIGYVNARQSMIRFMSLRTFDSPWFIDGVFPKFVCYIDFQIILFCVA